MLGSLRGRLVAAVLAIAALSSSAAATEVAKPGQALTAPVVIVVDLNRVQRDTLAGKQIAAQRDKYQQSFNSEFEGTRKQLQQTEQELAHQRTTLAADVFQEKARVLNESVATFQRRFQGAARALDKATGQASNDLQKMAITVTSEIASEMGAGLVMHKQHVFLHDERMDVTGAIIERINKRLPAVAFPAPEIEGAAVPAPAAKAPPKGKQ